MWGPAHLANKKHIIKGLKIFQVEFVKLNSCWLCSEVYILFNYLHFETEHFG